MYNLAYVIKSNKSNKDVKTFIFKVESNQTNKKVIHQILLIFYYMIQHSSRQPHSGEIDVKKSMSSEADKFKTKQQY